MNTKHLFLHKEVFKDHSYEVIILAPSSLLSLSILNLTKYIGAGALSQATYGSSSVENARLRLQSSACTAS